MKPLTEPNRIREIVNICTRIGIATFGSFIIGFPEETEEDLRDTVSFALSLNLDAYLFNYYVYIGGTPLFLEAEAKGRIRYTSIMEYLHGSPAQMLSFLCSAVKRAFGTFWHPLAHPIIRRKYGLRKQ